MNIKKIVIAILISVLISAGLYYGVAAVPNGDAITAILKDKFSLTMCVTIGGAFGILYLIYTIKKPALNEQELQLKKHELFYEGFNDEQKKIVDAMSEEIKEEFYVSYEKVLSTEKISGINSTLFQYTREQIPNDMKTVRKLAMIAFVVVIGLAVKEPLFAYIEDSNKIYNDQVLNIEGLPLIRLVSEGTFKQKEIDKYIEKNIKTQPAWLLAFATEIEIDSSDAYENKRRINSAAFASSDTMSICVDFGQTQNWKEAISHELCHLFDFYINGFNSSIVQALYAAAPNSITDYGSTNAIEFFAEAGEIYITNPEFLKTKNIDVYNYFNELFAPYQ